MLMTVAIQNKEVREKTLIADSSRELNIPLVPPLIRFKAAAMYQLCPRVWLCLLVLVR